MNIGEEITVFPDWFIINFVENPGMAFGWELPFMGRETGKIFLTLFRIAAVLGIGFYIRSLIKSKAPMGVVLGLSAVLAGAAGNIFDSLFYGQIFTESTYKTVASWANGDLPGYAPFLQGKVVDMLYFPLASGRLPDWLPIWGGEHFMFFRPVFNIADSAISVGVGYLVIFQWKYFKHV